MGEPKKTESLPKKIVQFFLREKILLALVIMFIAVSVTAKSFFTVGNLSNLLIQVGLYGVVALGMTFAIIGAEFDLGAGPMVSFSSMLVAILLGKMGIIPSVLLTLAVSTLVGLAVGLLVAKAKINSFIVTFGSMVMLQGLALTIGEGRPKSIDNEIFKKFGAMSIGHISLIFIIFFVLLVICHLVLQYTQFGRNIYAIGGNYDVAEATGINVEFYKAALFVLCSFFAGIGGILMAARVNTGHPTIGDDMTMTVIAGVVIGGTSLAGGKGNVWRTLLGIFVMMFLANAFDALVIQPYIQRAIKGMIIISVVAVDSYSKKRIEGGESIWTRLRGARAKA